jgi:hypothetical protein
MLKILNIVCSVLVYAILTACGSHWQVRTTSGQEFVVSDLELSTQDSQGEGLPVKESNSSHQLVMEGVKRLLFDQSELKEWGGRTWEKLRVDFEEDEKKGWNAPEQGLVGDQKLYTLSSAFIDGTSGDQRLRWPISDLSEVVMEGESFLTKDSEVDQAQENESPEVPAQ